jgi:hypothetical protein
VVEQMTLPPTAPRFVAQKDLAWLEHNRLESSRPRNVSTRLTRHGCESRNGEDQHNGLSPVPIRIAAGKLEIRQHEISFRCMVDRKLIDCSISHRVLLDLACAYSLSHQVSALAAFGELLSPIEKIASRKYEPSRFEQNGELKIGTADLLRYGFQIGRM